jgi:hypothetical protein
MYKHVTAQSELRQGDLFLDLPWLNFNPSKTAMNGRPLNIAEGGFPTTASLLVQAESAPGIIVSADCDCAGSNKHLIACRVSDITAKHAGFYSKSPKAKVETKLDLQRKSIGVYYLCPFGDFKDSYAELNYLQIFPRDFLLNYLHRRICTLSEEARHHMREKLGAYHTRFGPDERYFLTDEEQVIADEGRMYR